MFLGVDLGTSGLKLALVARDGAVVAESVASYDVDSPQSGFAETDPAVWEAGLEAAAREMFASGQDVAVTSIGVTGQMHGVVLVDHGGRPMRPAILWPDQRAARALGSWTTLDAWARARLANPIVAGMPGPILSWLREHEPGSVEAAQFIMTPKDWLRGTLTGDRVTERSDASGTLLWDVARDGWHGKALEVAGVSRKQLPTLVPSDEQVGTTRWWPESEGFRSAEAGAPHGTPVVAGGADTACALVALKETQPPERWHETLVVNIGTGVQILRPGTTASPRLDPSTHLYADTDGGWYEMVAIQNGGLALDWVQATLGLGWDDFVAAAQSAAPGSAGATFVPFLTGERGGVASADAVAGWSGLTPTVGRAELARSAFEALAFTIRRGLEVVGGHEGPLVLSGGVAREEWVRQLVADILQRPLSYVPLRSVSAVGAAVLAARGAGIALPVPAAVVDVVPSAHASTDAPYARWLTAVQVTRSDR